MNLLHRRALARLLPAAMAAVAIGPAAPGAAAPPGPKAAIVLRPSDRGETLRPGMIDGAYRAIGIAGNVMISDVTIDGMRARVARDCIRVNGSRIVVRNVHCSMLPPPQRSMHELPEGLHIKYGDHIRIEDSDFSNFQMVLPPRAYWNGDGVAVERDVTEILFRNVTSANNTDAGFDIKPPVSMDNVSASGNCRNFRFWSDADIGTITIGDVTKRGGNSGCAGIWLAGTRRDERPTIRIRHLIVSASRPLDIIKVDAGAATIRIDRCTIRAPRGSRLVTMLAQQRDLSLGRGCTL